MVMRSRTGAAKLTTKAISRRKRRRAARRLDARRAASPAANSIATFAPRGRACATSDFGSDCDHAQIAVAEHDVDREAHEHRVNRRARPQQDPLTGR